MSERQGRGGEEKRKEEPMYMFILGLDREGSLAGKLHENMGSPAAWVWGYYHGSHALCIYLFHSEEKVSPPRRPISWTLLNVSL